MDTRTHTHPTQRETRFSQEKGGGRGEGRRREEGGSGEKGAASVEQGKSSAILLFGFHIYWIIRYCMDTSGQLRTGTSTFVASFYQI